MKNMKYKNNVIFNLKNEILNHKDELYNCRNKLK